MNLRNRKETMGTLQLTCPIKGCEKIYTIVAYSNVGKSNFAYTYVVDALKK